MFYGHHDWHLLAAQCIGSFVICAATFIVAMIVFAILNAFGLLRISAEGERHGMDLHEHGISAYPEYVISGVYAPEGMPPHTINPVGASKSSTTPSLGAMAAPATH